MIFRVIRTLAIIILSSLLYLQGCSGVPANGELDHYVKEFEREVGVKVERVTIRFAELDGSPVGRCYPFVKIIQIEKSYFDTLSEIGRKALLYHELTHCVCNELKHDDTDSAFCPTSIMSTAMSSDWCYRVRWESYMADLRVKCQ